MTLFLCAGAFLLGAAFGMLAVAIGFLAATKEGKDNDNG